MKNTAKEKNQRERIPPPPSDSEKPWEWWQYSCRYWMSIFTPSEWKVFAMILDRTFGWKKRKEKIRRRHFTEGVHGKDGSVVHSGTGLSAATVDSALKTLEAMNAILVERHKHGSSTDCFYSLNTDWRSDAKTRLKSKEKAGNRPRKLGRPPQELIAPYPKGWGLNKGEAENGINLKKEQESPPSAPTVGGTVGVTRRRSLGSHAPAESKPSQLMLALPSADEVEQIWRSALSETFTGAAHAGWKVAEKANVKRLVKKWVDAKNPETFGTFVDWVVRQWRTIMTSKFGWMTDSPPPQFPAVGLFVKFIHIFVQAWGERESMKAKQSMSERELFVLRQTERGVDAEVAEQKADETFANVGTIARIKAEQAKLSKQQATAQRQQEYHVGRENVKAARATPARPVVASRPVAGAEFSGPDDFGTYDVKHP